MSTRNDVPLEVLREAAARGGQVSKARVRAAGGTLVYAEEGRLVEETPDGRREVVGESAATTVTLKRRTWKLR